MYVVYGKPDCKYCEYAKAALSGETFEYIDITVNSEILRSLKKQGFKSVPQIYYNGSHIGGYDNLLVHLEGE